MGRFTPVGENPRVDQFVQSQKAGGAQDSTGSFTLSAEKAREKLREFALEQPAAYCLKVVQAAVRSCAESIEIQVTRSEFQVRFEPTDESLLECDRVTAVLNQTHQLEAGALRHLVMALNSAGNMPQRRARWETPTGCLTIAEQGIELEAKPGDGFRFVVEHKRSLKEWFRGSVFNLELSFLREKCFYCPVPINIDGLDLSEQGYTEPGIQSLIKAQDLELPENRALFQHVAEGGDGLRIRTPLLEEFLDVPTRSGRIWNGEKMSVPLPRPAPLIYQGPLGEEPQRTDLAFILPPAWQRAGTLLVVHDGVSLDPLSVEDLGHPGAVVLAALEVDTDLSEFGVVVNMNLERRLERLRERVRAATESVLEKDLREVLARAGLDSNRAPYVIHWLTHHRVSEPSTMEELIWRCFPRELVKTGSAIDPGKLQNAMEVHQDHLPADEPVLALFDDTVFGSGKNGWLITPQRICWKPLMGSANYLLWEEWDGSPMESGNLNLKVMEAEIPTSRVEVSRRLERLFKDVRGYAGPPVLLGFKEDVLSLRGLALKHLKKIDGVHYHPYIPRKKLVRALKAYQAVLRYGEQPVVLFDDTLFGGGDTGFVITTERFAWRGILMDAKARDWQHLEQELVEATKSGVKIGTEALTFSSPKIGVPLRDLLIALGSAQRHPG